MYLLMRLLMLLPAQLLLPLYCSLGRANRKSECISINCCSSAKAIPIQEVQKLLFVDAAAFYAERLCMWCLANLVDIFWRNYVPKSLKQLCKTKQCIKRLLNNKQAIEKELFIHKIEICINSRMLVKSYRYWLLNWQS